MSKELEAFERIKTEGDIEGNELHCFMNDDDINIVENGLKRLESIDNANPSEALKCFERIDNTLCLNNIKGKLDFGIDDEEHTDCDSVIGMVEDLETIKQALLKAQEQEKVLNEALKLNGEWAEKLDYYQDLEKQLGCPLEVIFKALGHFIYDEGGNAWYIEHYYQEHNVYQLHSVRNFGRIADKKFNTKDYKKTWFLKKDKSE